MGIVNFILCACLLGVISQCDGKTVGNCPQSLPSKYHPSSFGDKCYVFFTDKIGDSRTASRNCYRLKPKGSVAKVDTPAINTFLTDRLVKDVKVRGRYWIDLYCEKKPGQNKTGGPQFKWGDGTPMTFENFDKKSIKWHRFLRNYNRDGKETYCVSLDAASGGKWYVEDYCVHGHSTESQCPVICEVVAPKTPSTLTTKPPPPTLPNTQQL